jgi:drug/metabolite transporter (DMT)-like permease
MLWLFFGLLTALAYSSTALTSRYMFRDKRIHPVAVEPMTSTIAMVLSLVLLAAVEGVHAVDGNILLWGVVTGTLGYGAALTWQWACRHEDASYVSPLLQLDAVIVTASGLLLLGEAISLWNAIGVLMIVFGGYLVAANGFKMPKLSTALALVLLSITLSAVMKVLVDVNVGEKVLAFNVAWYLGKNTAGWLAAILLGRGHITSSIEELVKNKKALGVCVIRSVGSFVASASLFAALSLGLMSKAVAVSSSAPLFTVIFGFAMLKEKHFALRLFASAMIVAGIALVAL